MFPLLLGWLLGKNSGKKTTIVQNKVTPETQTTKSAAKNVYNYNYLNDSLTGNTLFSSKEKTNRTLFGNSGV